MPGSCGFGSDVVPVIVWLAVFIPVVRCSSLAIKVTQPAAAAIGRSWITSHHGGQGTPPQAFLDK